MEKCECSIIDTLKYYDTYKSMFKAESCYVNSFLLSTMINSGTVNGVIGYVLSTDGVRKVAVRHAWVEKNNNIIDVTALVDGYSPASIVRWEYVPMLRISKKDWFNFTINNNRCPCIENIPCEKSTIDSIIEDGYEVLG